MSTQHANWFADALVRTSLAGIDTHGLRLLPLYLKELDEGRSNAKPALRIVKSHGSTVALDADNALGTVAGTHAAHLAVEGALRYGVGAVTVGGSNHFGAASVYGSLIAEQRMIGIVTTSAAARMAPFNGRVPMFGTNPVCFSAPAGKGQAYVLDMATSQVSYSQIKHMRKLGIQLPAGWALDAQGESTQDPVEVCSLSPLGGYKGQGLAMMVQILSCLLPGMPLDHELEHLDTGSFKVGRRIGHFFLAIDPSRFVEMDSFERQVAQLMALVRATPSRAGAEVLVAGDPQARCMQERLRTGIPLSAEEAVAFGTEEQACLKAGVLASKLYAEGQPA